MPLATTSHPAAPSLRRGRALLIAAVALAAAACGDAPLAGPSLDGGRVSLRLAPRVSARVQTPFALAFVRLEVTRLPDGAAVLDTLVPFDQVIPRIAELIETLDDDEPQPEMIPQPVHV